MANRIPPPDPETQRLSQAKKLEEAQKIAAISSVDPDAQAKKRRFKEMMTPDNEEKNSKESSPPPSSSPSPFEPSFHQTPPPSPEDFELEAIPSPYNSSPPDVNTPSPEAEDLLSDKGLPQSPEYWNQVDLPDQPIETSPQLIQEGGKSSREREHPGKKELPTKKIETSPFGPPDKPILQKKKGEKPLFEAKKTEKKESESIPKYWEKEGEQIQVRPILPKEKEKAKERPSTTPIAPIKPPIQEAPPPKEFSPFLQKQGGQEKEKEGKEREAKTTIDIVQPSTPAFAPATHFEAVSATQMATPYLRPETLPLFYQMVGTIFTMSNQGISTTEILLNNPAFAGSKFFGASIEIIKYSSAPDSFNIRLTGSNEAVTAFNQNIPGLMAAFQTGGFRFRVGRIEAAYATDRPMFRRKEKKGDTSSGDKHEGER